MKLFAKDCTGVNRDANWLYSSKRTQQYLKQQMYTVPPFLSARISSARMFQRLLQNAITSSLVIYIHREDTDRFRSSIKQVIATRKYSKLDVVDEDAVYKEIAQKSMEIRLSGSSLLTCPVYRSIEENRSNVVFVGIDKMDDLLNLLVRNFCPSYSLSNNRAHVNQGVNKPSQLVRLGEKSGRPEGATNDTVSLDEWIEAKLPLLEHAYEQRSRASCHGETRRIEQEVLACPDQAYWYSSHEFPVWHPFTSSVSSFQYSAGSGQEAPEDDEIPDEYLDDDGR